MTISYTELTNDQKMQTADLLQKLESIEGELADIQTARATAEIGYTASEQELKAEKNKLTQDIRNIRKATVVKL
jgi:hypothetical protein